MKKRLVINDENEMVPEIPVSYAVKDKVIVKNFIYMLKRTGSIRVRGMVLSKSDMLKLLDNADLIKKAIEADNLERFMDVAGVKSKKELKKLVDSL